MITKGIVEEVITQYKIKVRAPMLDRIDMVGLSTSAENLNIATICSLPNLDMNIKVGDVVFIGFEDNDYSKPIVLGTLYRSAASDTYCDLILNSLNIVTEANLPAMTSIGNITPDNIKCLENLTTNIQDQINILTDKVDFLMNHIK